MRFSKHEKALIQCLRRQQPLGLAHRPATTGYQHHDQQQYHHRRGFTSAPPLAQRQQDIAVLGGGITGLATAHYLAQAGHKVTIFEGSDRLGGWIQSKYVDVPGGRVLFEQGPRTLRPSLPNGYLTWALMHDLDMTQPDRILGCSKKHPAARSRFIYYPDHLVKLPGGSGMGFWGNVSTIWKEPLFAPMWKISLTQLLTQRTTKQDESIGDFISRRLNEDVANNIVSAVAHGIYAGDIWKLSAESIMPALWRMDGSNDGLGEFNAVWKKQDAAILQNMVKDSTSPATKSYFETMRGLSFFSFKEGLQDLSETLARRSQEATGITIRTQQPVRSLSVNKGSTLGKVKVEVAEENATSETFDQVVSTLPYNSFSKIMQNSTGSWPQPSETNLGTSVTVNVVNLFWAGAQNNLPVNGFGYLIPQSVPYDQNPELALGVIFDSAPFGAAQDTVQGTKVTVMLGGHYWNGWKSYPNKEESIKMARAILERHLGITAEPTATHFSHQRDCIPQYLVGHRKELARLHNNLLGAFHGRVKVAGSSYTGVGINDCIRAAWDVANSANHSDTRELTGLQDFVKEQEWERFDFGMETQRMRLERKTRTLERELEEKKKELEKRVGR